MSISEEATGVEQNDSGANDKSAGGGEQVFKMPLPAAKDGNGEEKSHPKAVEIVSPSYELKHTLHGHLRYVSVVKFSPRGDQLASASADRLLKLWDVDTAQFEKTLEGHNEGINDVCWSPDSKFLISCSDDKTIRLWDPQTGQQRVWLLHQSAIEPDCLHQHGFDGAPVGCA